eukprot:3432873-Alexandrium_andersonii.AAC.1
MFELFEWLLGVPLAIDDFDTCSPFPSMPLSRQPLRDATEGTNVRVTTLSSFNQPEGAVGSLKRFL